MPDLQKQNLHVGTQHPTLICCPSGQPDFSWSKQAWSWEICGVGGGGPIVSRTNLTHTLTIPTSVSSVAAERAHRKPGLQGNNTSDSHDNWSPRARQQEAGKTPGRVPSGTSPSFLATHFYLPAWLWTLLGYRRPGCLTQGYDGILTPLDLNECSLFSGRLQDWGICRQTWQRLGWGWEWGTEDKKGDLPRTCTDNS